ncbi:Metacaspase type II [Favolaschia claudopus]|uniref:Metacaspase type II n=1 Tax=Favolaschia claudopus TaxID=2862362 RepID=A0AAW0A0F9_9AGAR
MAHIDLENGSQFSLSQPFDSAPIPGNDDYTGRKRALLIGIRACTSDGYPDLDMAHDDVYKMRDLLIKVYQYEESEITILLDDGVHVQPTRNNILAAIVVFVKNVKAGDRLCFHYSGCSIKAPNPNWRSSDQPDDLITCLVPCDGEQMKILNTELRDILVRPLPAGSCLVAILDADYSGSLLGRFASVFHFFHFPVHTQSSTTALKHYRCNRVYVPWLWRGRRDSELIRSTIVRRGARLVSLPQNLRRWLAPYLPTRHPIAPNGRQPSNIGTEAITISRRTATTTTSPTTPLRTSPLTRLRVGGKLSLGMLRTLSLSSQSSGCALKPDTQITDDDNWILHEEEDAVRRCESPLGQLLCSGWCRNVEGGSTMFEEDWGDVKADVISLASCKYSQPAWGEGITMIVVLAQVLRENPNRSLQDILTQISHGINSGALVRHSDFRRYKAEYKVYTSYLMHQPKQLDGSNRSSASLNTPSNPGILSHSELPPTTSRPCGGSKKSVLLHEVCEQTHAMAFKSLEEGYDSYLTSAFQNPELSSPRPLDMNRPWRM